MAVRKTAVSKKFTSAKELADSKIETIKVPTGVFTLVIVESPSKAKTIKKYLGKGYEVIASNGHIKDLPKSTMGVDVGKTFNMELVPITGKKNIIAKISKLASKAQKVLLAPDPDREGEAIAFHIAEEIKDKKKIGRVLFNAITQATVLEAVAHPLELDQKKYDSQKTRRILDRLVGYKISPILWDKVQRGLSAGRVQSVALRIIVERDDEIKAFIPEQWFSIQALLEKSGRKFEIKYYGDSPDKKNDISDKLVADTILKKVKGKDFVVSDIKKRERKQNPTAPFTTSKLQQEGVNKLGFTTKKTMMVAQKLYEGIEIGADGLQGLITYMRTDSVRTEPQALSDLRKYIEKEHGKKFLASDAIIYKKKGTGKVQDAHESIRPTNLKYNPDFVAKSLSEDELKLYTLIWNKYISSQMAPAVIDQTTVTFNNQGHFFKASGSIIKFAGFRTLYLDSLAEKKSSKEDENEDEVKEQEGILPELDMGEKFKAVQGPASEEHWTSPPPRYNEASLVKELEEKGIGRPSTYAAIISNIQDKGYVAKTENRFHPTELGIMVCRMLVQSFPHEMDVAFTAKMEEELDRIEEGEVKWDKVLKTFWKDFEATLVKAKEEMKNLKKQEIPTGIQCKRCAEGEMMIKWGRNGQFLACSKYPDCKGTDDFKKDSEGHITIIEKQFSGDPCPTCNKRLVLKTGKFGRFFACEDYPSCKTALPYTLDVLCPKCHKNKIAEKKSRFGKMFYGCSGYPNCVFAMWNPPVKKKCPDCDSEVMGEKISKKTGKFYECPVCKAKVADEAVNN
ncbi:MAG: type I DNA topoisomerase [Bacteriovoracaceae bacterium]|nr:type I DNA topoisomerase [Bacteriovoracaceae bacterium]